jgi:Rod binding domain-containing protein
VSLAPIDRAALPIEVRRGSPERQRAYAAAVSFERQLVTELTKTLQQTVKASPAAGAHQDLLPGAMADALTAGGGLGLARELDRALHPAKAPEAGSGVS